MANVLAKLPQQRIRAGEKHPTTLKLEKLFDYMDELRLELVFDWDTVYVIDQERPQDKDWEIRDIVNSNLLRELPCYPNEYKLTQNVDVPPRDAQPAPIDPVVKKKTTTIKPVTKKAQTPPVNLFSYNKPKGKK